MRKESIRDDEGSRVHWDHLEEWVRGQVQSLIQELLEEELTEFLGRARSARRFLVESRPGYRNGHGKPRRLTLGAGTVEVRRPRVRSTEERFQSRVLPLFVRQSTKVRDLLPQLYLHGLAEGDFDLALRGLLGDEAPVSASTVARLKDRWQGEYQAWRRRSLEELEVVYLWVDGVYVKAGLEKEKAAVLVALAALTDGRKVIVAIEPGYRESTESWSALLRDLKARGMGSPCLVIGDGHLGIWGALRNVFPEAKEQRCWNHKVLNVLDRLPKRAHGEAKPLLCSIPYRATRNEAEERRDAFVSWCGERGYQAAAETLVRDWDRMVTFYDYPQVHWQHLRTTNPIESPFAALRLRTDAAKRYKRVDRATALIWKLLMVGERRFQRLRGRELLPGVYHQHRQRSCHVLEYQRVLEEVPA
ncbi:MAG: IS256 family transposase [Dehalococcoidia bacterium]